MRWEIDGELLEIQGSVQRASDIFATEECKVQLDEDSRAGASYTFTHNKLGDLGSIRVSVLPKNKTEVYGYPPKIPDKKWLIEYLPRNFLGNQPDDLLLKLINAYAWQIEQGIFEQTASKLFRLAFEKRETDMGWDKFGLADFELQKQAEADLEKWRHTLHVRRTEEFNQITGVILTQIRLDGLSLVVFNGQTGEGKFLKPSTPDSATANLAKEPSALDRKEQVECEETQHIEGKTPKEKKPNLQTRKRAVIWRELRPWILSMKIDLTVKECIAEIKKRPGYKEKKISRQRMERILREGYSGVYDEILKSL